MKTQMISGGRSIAPRSRNVPTQFFKNFKLPFGGGPKEETRKPKRNPAVDELLEAIEGTDRGLKVTAAQKEQIAQSIEALTLPPTEATATPDLLSARWRLVYTTEKETLWIVKNAGLFGTQAGEIYQERTGLKIYQTIDVDAGTLANIITFPPDGSFVVDSTLAVAGPQRTTFKFTGAGINLPGGKEIGLPPFGQGWFETVYIDDEIRISLDSRGDTLVTVRDDE